MVVSRSGFWKSRNVFLTGHTGFKGSWLALWLAEAGANVTGYALPAEAKSHFNLARIGERITSIEGDIRDLDKLQRAISAAQPQVVFHLAAQALVRPSYADPVGTFSTNVMGTVHVLEAARRCDGLEAVVNVTSDKCYQNREWVYGYRETDPMGGHDPYSASKGCAELVGASYHSAFLTAGDAPFKLASARAGNVIGGGDWAKDRLIVDCIGALLDGRPIEIRNPKATRPWQHVLEPLGGYLQLAQAMIEGRVAAGEGWNFGPNDKDIRAVEWIVERLCQHWGRQAGWQKQPGSHPHEAGLLKLDISKARQVLQWEPRLVLDEALRWTVEWYRSVIADNQPAQRMSLAQIEAYQQLG
jgi:CDP-glucose 4,6-dehydratase